MMVTPIQHVDGDGSDDDDVTCSRGLPVRSDLVLTLSTKISITNRPMTANATYDVISFRTALGAARTVKRNEHEAVENNRLLTTGSLLHLHHLYSTSSYFVVLLLCA